MIQVINGEVVRQGLPKSYVNSSGETVLNYHLQDQEVLRLDGWFPLEENMPEFNSETEWLRFDKYELLEEKVIKHYTVERIEKSKLEILEERLLTPIEMYEKTESLNVSLEELKELKKNKLNYQCTKTILGRFECILNDEKYQFSYDTEAQLQFTGTCVLMFTGKLSEIQWTAYKNGERVRIILSSEDFNAVSSAALNHQNSNIVKYNKLLETLSECESKEEVANVEWID